MEVFVDMEDLLNEILEDNEMEYLLDDFDEYLAFEEPDEQDL